MAFFGLSNVLLGFRGSVGGPGVCNSRMVFDKAKVWHRHAGANHLFIGRGGKDPHDFSLTNNMKCKVSLP